VSIREIRVKKLRAFANSAATARIPSWFEFIRYLRLLGRPCQAGFAGVWFRHEKPMRFRAGRELNRRKRRERRKNAQSLLLRFLL
jgi:hypothetical protein